MVCGWGGVEGVSGLMSFGLKLDIRPRGLMRFLLGIEVAVHIFLHVLAMKRPHVKF